MSHAISTQGVHDPFLFKKTRRTQRAQTSLAEADHSLPYCPL